MVEMFCMKCKKKVIVNDADVKSEILHQRVERC